MDFSTPPSRLARRNNTTTLVKTNGDSPIPSLDLVLSSPKSNDTPLYPSPASLYSPSSPVTLREILLLSPSPLRKSRTRLANRFEMEAAEAARRCKTKGGQSGLLGSASPRSCRRSRRRSEVVVVEEETKPVVVVLTDEKMTKPRKHKKTGRSKKEKQSSLPSSDLNVCEGDLERIRENINDLIMWRDVAKSTLWFGFGCLCFLSSCFAKGFSFSVFSAVSHVGLLYLGVSFLSHSLRQRVIEETEGREVKVSEEDVLRVARRMLPITNLVISKMTQLFSGEPAMTLKVAPFALIGAEYGYLITLWRLFALGFFLSFTVPKLYSSYASQINQKVENAQKRIVEAWGICTHKKFVAGSMITAFWNLTSLKIRFFTVFIIVVVIRYKRQNVQLDSEEDEEKQPEGQTQTEQPEEKTTSPPIEEEQALVVVAAETEAPPPKKL
ncbi:PREDICTED: reticulon-like protein B18 isoform X2 [Brassica oleracea var. oleracea]|uniref:reticulon-like protein B18 isoform X2 n=1 Tax=Brassica oleracea var. oleracea TaxID=109376 RepID=UPI0006A6F080|nr:PREDICTED: reticulon-like protein B18 isoform X2 [Brassica oleracea var. oleracea]